MIRKNISLFLIFLLLTILLLSSILSSCVKNKESAQTTITTQQAQTKNSEESESREPGYLDLYEGLHITGDPTVVDIKTYQLKISGAVNKEISLTFDDVKKMKSVREEIELVCPGYFIDKGYWTGVRVIDLLNLVGVKKEAKNIEFIGLDWGNYKQKLPIEKVKGDGFLIAYQFNDNEFSKYHGYPLRLVAKGESGSYWVKWLGEIRLVAD